MSLFLLLLALQGAGTPTDPPPLKVRTVQPAVASATAPSTKPSTGANPKITYVPAKPKADEAAAPATKSGASPLSGISESARARLAEEKEADTARRAELRREMIAAQEAIAKALATEPLDLAALQAALERRDQVMAQSRSKVTLAVVDLLGDISAEERLTVAKALIESDSASPRPAPEQKPKPSPVGR